MDNIETAPSKAGSQPLDAKVEGDDVIFDFNVSQIYSEMDKIQFAPGSKTNSGTALESSPGQNIGEKTAYDQPAVKMADVARQWLPEASGLLEGITQGGKEEEPDRSKGTPDVSDRARPSSELAALSKLADELKADDPVGKLNDALDKLDGVDALSVTRNGASRSHVYVDFKESTVGDAPNIRVKGFSPQSTRVAEKVSFNMQETENGLRLSDMRGFTSTVRGPLGGVRGSTSHSMTIGSDRCGPYIDSTSSMRVLGKSRCNTVRLREQHFDADSPMRQLMKQPEAMDKVKSMMRLFRKTDDIDSFKLDNNRDGTYDVSVGARGGEHIEVHEPISDLNLTVDSIDLSEKVSAKISRNGAQAGGGVSLEDISGLTVNLDTYFGPVKLNPLRVSMQNDSQGRPVMELEVQNPALKNASVNLKIPVDKPRIEKATIKLHVPLARVIYDSIEGSDK